MKSTLFTLVSIALVAFVSACAQPSQSLVPGAIGAQAETAATARARFIYFAGIQSASGGGGFLGPGELGVYPATANGNVAPLHVIAGRNTGLFEGGGCCVPQSAWFDAADGSIWTCRTFSTLVSRFATNRGRRSWGNVKPSGTLVISPKTVSCGGVAVAKNGDVVADDINAAFVATWRAGATGGAAPIRTIAGPATGLFLPSQITFDDEGNSIVSDRCTPPKCSSDEGGEILTFGANAKGNASPLRVLAGAKTQLSGPNRVAFDAVHDTIYVANIYTSTITGYPHGSKTHLWNPDAIAVDKAGYLYVGNEPIVPGPPPASIVVFAPGANGNVAPVQIIEGSKTQLAEVNGLSVY